MKSGAQVEELFARLEKTIKEENTDLAGYNTSGTAGKILKDAQKKAKGAYLNTI